MRASDDSENCETPTSTTRGNAMLIMVKMVIMVAMVIMVTKAIIIVKEVIRVGCTKIPISTLSHIWVLCVYMG